MSSSVTRVLFFAGLCATIYGASTVRADVVNTTRLLSSAELGNTHMPGTPNAQSSRMQMPGTQMPGMQMPGMQMPVMQMPGMQMPEEESSRGANGVRQNPKLSPDSAMPSGHLEFNEVPELAKDSKIYSLVDFQKLAEDHNPTLIQAKQQIKGERGKARQAGIWPNPFMAYSGDLLGAPGAGLGEFEGGMVGQDIILGGKLKYSRRKYEARASAAEQQAIAQSWRVRNDVAIAFAHVLADSERINLEREMLKSIRDHWLTKQEMHNMGQANLMSLRDADIDLALQRTKVLAAQYKLELAWQELSTVVGVELPLSAVSGKLDDSPPELKFDTILKQLLEQSPELGEAKEKLRSDQITLQREHRQPIPNLGIVGGSGYDQIDRGAVAQASVALTNVPLFNRNQGTIQQAEADLARQYAQVRLVELSLRRSLAIQYNRYKTALQYLRAYKDIVIPESREKYVIALDSYKDTRLEWPDVLHAQRDYINARLDYIGHLLESRESEIELHGFLLTGGLVAPPGVTPPGHIDATPQPR